VFPVQDGPVERVELATDDLVLRLWRPSDAAAVHRACQHPSLHPWAADVESLVTARPVDAVLLGVFDAADGGLLGGVDLRDLDRRRRTAELGYWTAPWARGHRVAERAARTLLTWAFDSLGLVRVDWRAAVGNHPSRLTGLRLGFRMIGERPGPVPEWLAALEPGDPRTRELGRAVRSQARVFGGAVPVLAAGRVTLRAPAVRDEAAMVAANRDPEVVRWFGVAESYAADDARRYVTEQAPLDWKRGAEAAFVIADRADAYAGGIDLRVTPHDPEAGEVGFLVAPPARGRGYAPAALAAITRWGFDELGLHRVQWRAEVGNEASRRVAEKAGYRMEGVLRQSLAVNGRRCDCWVGSALSRDGVAG
jgi:RimJ/RimL family protein N-acetyltransferase